MPPSCGVGYQQLQTVVPRTFFSSCKWSFQSEFRRMTIVFNADVKGSMFGRRCCVVFVLTSDITLKNVLQQGDKTLKNYISCPFVSRLQTPCTIWSVSFISNEYPGNMPNLCKMSYAQLQSSSVQKSSNMRQSCYATCCTVYIRCQINLTGIKFHFIFETTL